MGTKRTAGFAVWMGALTALGAGNDLLSQADRTTAELRQYVVPALVRGALFRETPRSLATRIVQSLELRADAELFLVGPDGRCWLSSVSSPGRGPAARDTLWAAVRAAPTGVSSDFALNQEWTELVRRDVGWQELQVLDWVGRVVIEQQHVLAKDPAHPWSGKWIGASSRQGLAFTDEAVTAVREASPLSAMCIQSGASCWIRLTTAGWAFTSRGTLHEDTLRAGATGPVRILNLAYSPADDRLRGTLESVAPEQVGVDKIFLQRVRVE